MTALVVEYDARCGLCCAIARWIGRQPQLVPVTCRPKPAGETDDDLRVVADTGEYWSGDAAWVMVVWALADYRHWAYRLASPSLLPTARAAFARLSAYRGRVSCGLGLAPDEPAPDAEA